MATLITTAIVLGSALLLFVLAELVARFCLRHFGGYYPFTPHHRQRFELDRASLPMMEPVVRWSINSDGERGDEYVPGDTRVLLAGGSCVECYYLDQPSTVSHQLQEALNARWPKTAPNVAGESGRHIHVGGLGKSKINCGQIRFMLEKSFARYGRLDAVVLMVGASDLVRWLELGTPEDDWQDPAPMGHIFGQHPELEFGWRPGQLALRAALVRLVRRLRKPEEHRTAVGARLVQLRERRNAATPKVDSVPDLGPMLDRFDRNLGRLIDDLKARADVVVVSRQPWMGGALTEDQERWMWNYATGPIYSRADVDYFERSLVDRMLSQVAERCGEVTRRHGAVDVDMPALLESSLENFYDENHFTPAGAKRVAELLADAVVAARASSRGASGLTEAQ